ncbi:hypothetical protein L596_022727 [Steinernema carpocapsae]|uniref:C-type lectin domain-containing protein n=1 Tax=Steinernema carpocapsae TaxID=34508 RepID=A0A4U5MMN0_STECR|nr:hypothetical protein L596_022727 [Steinernema carpocapsae]
MPWKLFAFAFLSFSTVFADPQIQKVDIQINDVPSQPKAQNQIQDISTLEWKEFGDFLYYFSDNWMSWQEAEDFCVAHGAHLASIHNAEENDFIAESCNDTCWIGGESKNKNAVFTWVDSTKMVYTAWFGIAPWTATNTYNCLSSQRLNCRENETCDVQLSEAKWWNARCTCTFKFACKKTHLPSQPKDQVQIQEITTLAWKEFGTFLYFFSEDKKPWNEAEDFCVAHGAHLASIHSEEENDFIGENCGYVKPYSCWIGAVSNQKNEVYTWVDSNKMTYTAWFRSQPWNDSRTWNCVEIVGGKSSGGGKWWSAHCDLRTGRPGRFDSRFVCKKGA